jgi:hypothetical protein
MERPSYQFKELEMDIKPVTAQQLAKLQSAVAARLNPDGQQPKASLFAEPKISPVDLAGVLHPDVGNTVNEVKIHVLPNSLIGANDILIFYWEGDTESIASETASPLPTSEKVVPVPPALVIAAASSQIFVAYLVVDDANPDGQVSEILKLSVDKYTTPVMSVPVITEAVNGVLDVHALTAAAHVTVAAWSTIAVGQTMTLSSPQLNLTSWVQEPVTSTGTQATTLALGELQTLKDGTTFTLNFEVFSATGTSVGRSTVSYTITNVEVIKAISITRVYGADNVAISNGGTTTYTSVTVEGTVTLG